MHLKKKKKISCFRYHGLCQDKEKHRKPADFFFLPHILYGSKGCGLKKAGQKMEEKYKTELHYLWQFFCVAVLQDDASCV